MKQSFRSAVAAACLTVGGIPAAGQSAGWIEASIGSVRPFGRLAELQDGGLLLAIALERGHEPGWGLRTVLGHAEFRADDRQHPTYADGPWLPFDLDFWTLGVQLVNRAHAAPVAVVPAFGFGADYLRSTTVYDITIRSDGRRFREVYPAAEASLQLRWRPVRRIGVLAEVRGHVLLTTSAHTEILFRAAGASAGDEAGTHWLGYLPVALGVRIAL